MFHDREDAARQLAQQLQGRPLRDPVILGIPRGGVVIGSILARALGAELDVALARKLRAPHQPELAIGAVGEDGRAFLNQPVALALNLTPDYLLAERRRQLEEINRRKELYRNVRPAVPLAGRSVLVTDDGIATGSTMIAALQAARTQDPFELIVAAPVAAPDRLEQVRRWCDDAVCLYVSSDFIGVGQFYSNFAQVSDAEVVELLKKAGKTRSAESSD
jgi:putative phosphoribosyl transferase